MNPLIYRRLKPIFNFLTFLTIVFVLAPLLVSLAISFSQLPFATFPPRGFTLKWYEQIATNPDFLSALQLSMALAVTSTLFSLIVGIPASLVIARSTDRYLARTCEAILLSPLLLPVLITGLSLLQFSTWSHINDPIANMFIGYTVVTIPYVIRTVVTSLKLVNPSLEEAARTLGANSVRAFFRITMIQIAPGVMSGALFSFMVSLDNYTISMWFSDASSSPLPIFMMKSIDNVFDPSIAAMAGVMLVLGSLIVLVLERLVGLRRSMGI